jgi:tetrahydromethanopterin S-methyltransferase subunit F
MNYEITFSKQAMIIRWLLGVKIKPFDPYNNIDRCTDVIVQGIRIRAQLIGWIKDKQYVVQYPDRHDLIGRDANAYVVMNIDNMQNIW